MSREFVMLIGLPGSGKSTVAREFESSGFRLFSSDKYRKKLNLKEGETPPSLFPTILKDMRESLDSGESVVFDATNLSSKKRKHIFKEISHVKGQVLKTAFMVLAPFEVCLERNSSRTAKVPMNKMVKFYQSWQTPHEKEGYDRLLIKRTSDKQLNKLKLLSKTIFFNQENKNHKYSLFGHLVRAYYWNRKKSKKVRVATLFHDIGKVNTKTFVNKKGERGTNAHYYNHEHVGAYDALFFNFKDLDPVEISTLICYHMRPYTISSEEKGQKTFGKRLWGELTEVHAGDVRAH